MEVYETVPETSPPTDQTNHTLSSINMNIKTDLERKTSADNTSIQSKPREMVTKVLAETYRRLTPILRGPKAQPSSRSSNNQVAKIDI